jgi:hypothetical protein
MNFKISVSAGTRQPVEHQKYNVIISGLNVLIDDFRYYKFINLCAKYPIFCANRRERITCFFAPCLSGPLFLFANLYFKTLKYTITYFSVYFGNVNVVLLAVVSHVLLQCM